MKRTVVLTLLALIGFTAANAQHQFATLQHGDSISAYYGQTAFSSAYNAAVNGDIITLSPGIFGPTDVNKAITIRGAGMFQDTLTHTVSATIFTGPFTINIPQDSVYTLTMEGLSFPHNLFVANAYDPTFIKCYFSFFNASSQQRTMVNANFLNCIVHFYGCRLPITATNCVIYTVGSMRLPMTAYNCILPEIDAYDSEYAAILHNCIYKQYRTDYLWAYNCLEMGAQSDSAYASIFKEYRGTFDYNNPVSFELQDSIANTVLGSDGTQVGIYGGQFPFTPRVNNYTTSVAGQSRPDGKLEVTIQPINE